MSAVGKQVDAILRLQARPELLGEWRFVIDNGAEVGDDKLWRHIRKLDVELPGGLTLHWFKRDVSPIKGVWPQQVKRDGSRSMCGPFLYDQTVVGLTFRGYLGKTTQKLRRLSGKVDDKYEICEKCAKHLLREMQPRKQRRRW